MQVFEVAPIAMLVERAGGASSCGAGSALDVVIENMDQRVPFCVGSSDEVRAHAASNPKRTDAFENEC